MSVENEDEALDESAGQRPGKNIIICLDGTGNQFGENRSNVVKLFRMLERSPEEQVAYYDPGVGTMGDPVYKTRIARKVNKVLGLAFGRGLTKNLIEAYTYLMEHYEDGDRVFIFGFSRGAYTARALAGFIKVCGLFEKGAENLIPYAMGLYLKKAPKPLPEEVVEQRERDGLPPLKDPYRDFFKVLSAFRSTYGRRFRKERVSPGKNPYHYQLRIHFLGLFDTVKSYGWVRNPVVLRNETNNPSILHLRHALAIDERRIFFRQMHWKSSSRRSCKEVWFAGVHSDVGGGYPEAESGLAKIPLEWMVHEACSLGMKVDPYRYGRALGRKQNADGEWEDAERKGYPAPNPNAEAHESLKGAWKAMQLLPKSLESWELNRRRRTIVDEQERLKPEEIAANQNPLLVHQSVLDRFAGLENYRPENLLAGMPEGKIESLSPESIEHTIPVSEAMGEPPAGLAGC